MTDYNLIDRISAIKLELEYETENIYSILIAIRNILHQSDGMSYLEIKNALIEYFNTHPHPNVTNNIINLITNPATANNNSMITILLNYLNQSPLHFNYNSELNSDDEIDSDDEEIIEESNYNINDQIQPIYDIAGNNVTDYVNNVSNTYNQYLSNIFYGTGNIQFNNNFEPNISENINSILTLSNMLNNGVDNFETTNNNSLNLFTQIFNNINNNTGAQNNEDIPIVITEESYDKLRKCDYVELEDELKSKNAKCMITLDNFNENDKVLVLPCDHVFKLEEITSWLKDNSYKCPSCRNPCGKYYAKLN